MLPGARQPADQRHLRHLRPVTLGRGATAAPSVPGPHPHVHGGGRGVGPTGRDRAPAAGPPGRLRHHAPHAAGPQPQR
ncbi:hypothetical protein ACFFX0_27510 [Citricoccus parietis]|uniref:Uncharacterized protein n=1 Tax=Citricoccus parietis TaxID=592307 RepID=A0ABV5G719_9MICC